MVGSPSSAWSRANASAASALRWRPEKKRRTRSSLEPRHLDVSVDKPEEACEPRCERLHVALDRLQGAEGGQKRGLFRRSRVHVESHSSHATQRRLDLAGRSQDLNRGLGAHTLDRLQAMAAGCLHAPHRPQAGRLDRAKTEPALGRLLERVEGHGRQLAPDDPLTFCLVCLGCVAPR